MPPTPSRTTSEPRPRRILVMSSQVARGHVGLSAIGPVLQRLGIDVIGLPTVLLSNHPGHGKASGQQIEVGTLTAMVSTLEVNGWLTDIDAVLLGYLPSTEHVELAADISTRIRRLNSARRPVILCDPVIGDDPKGVYLDVGAANAIRTHLVPIADILTPNRFELAWLSNRAVTDPATAIEAARILPNALIAATSIPDGPATIGNMCITPDTTTATSVERRDHVPNGTGDVFSALFLARYLSAPSDLTLALKQTTTNLQTLIARSIGKDELDLIGAGSAWLTTNTAAIESKAT